MTSTSSSSTDPSSPGAPALVLEGARRDAQWALAHEDRIVGGRIKDRGAAERLATEVEGGLRELGLDASQIVHVIVGIGPGSYAGLRIVLAFAKGITHALGAKIVAVPSLQAMLRDVDLAIARGEAVPAHARRIAMMNAFGGQLFAAGGGVKDDAYTPASFNAALGDGNDVLGVIDGELPMRRELAVPAYFDLRTVERDLPFGVLAIGREMIARGDFADVTTLLPRYGQASSAELKANGIA